MSMRYIIYKNYDRMSINIPKGVSVFMLLLIL